MKKWLIFSMVSLPVSVAAAQAAYVQSAKAKIMASPAFDAPLIVEVARGDKLNVVEAQSRWLKVQVPGGKSGWISKLVVSDQAPLNRVTVFGSGEASIEKDTRRRASAVTTAGAARGLTPEDRQRASQSGLANYAALERMESIHVSEGEAMGFLTEGLKQ